MSGPLEQLQIVLSLVDGCTILDVACGMGRFGYILRINWWGTKKGEICAEPEYLVGIDIFLPFLKKVKYHKVYDDVVLCDASFLPFRGNSFNVVIASEVLEHVEKKRGIQLLKEAERVSSKTIIFTTPHFVRKRGGLPTPEGFNPYEKHVCRWSIKELHSMGYRVYGTGFFPSIAFFKIPTLFLLVNSILSPI
jgi:ubiquinone/menaquinone biosynthesis C-methylase UbiE